MKELEFIMILFVGAFTIMYFLSLSFFVIALIYNFYLLIKKTLKTIYERTKKPRKSNQRSDKGF